MSLFARSIDCHATFLERKAICVYFIGDLAPLDGDLREKMTAI
jgi:hypothetical protein